ncbi:diphosphomevalonate decarboxylase [Synchytrium microbalum]|uniref:Diphosphomevalonate decarboxylase n=1 Tax=Synchytrium microbalum TaxID=1806994 RepID=A0A507BZB2_9FUNG|nr:diphosphomevalonate decarboxylase [Synchytrium microbalum]TPX30613.1 diphosphomevalonate decarboxylase [Synchytrium microbalum]
MVATNSTVHEVTVTAPVNIAVIKYWGKRDTALILPTNSSLSVTLNQDHLHSKTTVRADPSFTSDTLWLNGKGEDVSASKRLKNVVLETKRLRKEMEDLAAKQGKPLPPLSSYGLHIASNNNFPTAAGLASSASGFAALTFALSQLYELLMNASEVSRLARVGSGSACRSLFGGFVAWEMGIDATGVDSLAVQVAPETHWPDMEALIFVVSDAKKATSSTEGMQTTVETSDLLQHRIDKCVPERMQAMITAIKAKDFDSFAEITMKDSNQFHSVCLDTYPPIFYLNDTSRGIIHLLTQYNSMSIAAGKGYKCAYTFDAGPNAVVYLPKGNVAEVLALVEHYFAPPANVDVNDYYGRALDIKRPDSIEHVTKGIRMASYEAGSLKRVIYTSVGDGPRVLAAGYDAAISLLKADGHPLHTV